jgi:signal transduction histidine kinase
MNLRNKILTLAVILVILLGLSIAIFIKTSLKESLLSGLREKGISETRYLAHISTNDLLTGNKLSLRLMLNEYVASNKEIEYIFIQDTKNNIFVHTFHGIFPKGLKDINIANKTETHSIQPLNTNKGTLIDIAVPISNGELGVIHIGFSEEHIKGNIDSLIKSILWIITFILALGCGLTFVLSSLITRPIRKLTEVAKEIGSGNFDHKVGTDVKDEIGQLSRTFDQMADNLKTVTASRDDLDKEIKERKKAEAERKKLEQALLDIEERERKRIGYDLHDGLGQLLTGISFKLASLVGRLKESSSSEAKDIADIAGIINDAKKHVAQLSKGLLPLELESDGIVAAIEKLSSYPENTLGISSSFRYSKSFSMNNEKSILHLYRITQEAVNNAVKHSNAKHIAISLFRENDQVELTIKDDGTGIPEKLGTEKGMGLQIMKYRAEIIGASFNIQSSASKGTLIECIMDDKI